MGSRLKYNKLKIRQGICSLRKMQTKVQIKEAKYFSSGSQS